MAKTSGNISIERQGKFHVKFKRDKISELPKTFPTLHVKPCDVVRKVKQEKEAQDSRKHSDKNRNLNVAMGMMFSVVVC